MPNLAASFARTRVLLPLALLLTAAGGYLAIQRPASATSATPPRIEPEIVPAPETTLPLHHAPRPTSAAITPADLLTRLYIFADDSMLGRETGALGNYRATAYLAREAARLGLRPAGDGGTYFQDVPVMTRALAPGARFVAGGRELRPGRDWGADAPAPVHLTDARTVYGGRLNEGTPAFDARDIAGMIVVFEPHGHIGHDLLDRARRLAPGAAAIVLVDPGLLLRGFFPDSTRLLHDTTAAGPAEAPVLWIADSLAPRLFGRWLALAWRGAHGAPASLDLVPSFTATPFAARNVVAVLPGGDPALVGEYVALGAHSDHIGVLPSAVDHDSVRIFDHIVRPEGADDRDRRPTSAQMAAVARALAAWRTAHPGARPDSIANGADDDGSGAVALLEVAESLAAAPSRPRRSLLFVWHTGEEEDLWGSTWYTDHPTVPRDSIVAQVNVDMLGRGDPWDVTGYTAAGAPIHGDPNYLQVIGAGRLSSELGRLVDAVDSVGGFGLHLDRALDADGHPEQVYCRSDHYEYARWGIPVAFFSTGGHSDYHEVTDEPQYVDYDHFARVTRFVSALAARVAGLDHRLVVDHPRPDPAGACHQ